MDVRKRLVSIVILFIILVFSWLVFNTTNRKPIIFSDFGTNIPASYPVLGIDVSHHQGDIHWPELSAMNIDGDSVRFVYIKATEGLDFIDPNVEQNSNGARQENLLFGYYHFFLPGVSAKQQAEYFVAQTSFADFNLNPVLDIEVTGKLSQDALTDSILVFLDQVEEKIGRRPLIYTYENFYLGSLKGTRTENEMFWIASYNNDCSLMNNENFLLWQFSETGTVNGIKEKVDLNIAKKSFLDLCVKKKEAGVE